MKHLCFSSLLGWHLRTFIHCVIILQRVCIWCDVVGLWWSVQSLHILPTHGLIRCWERACSCINLKRATLRWSRPADVGESGSKKWILNYSSSYWANFHLTEFPLLLPPFFTSPTRPSGGRWEIRNGARASVSFSNRPLNLNIWSYGEEGDPVNGSPCLPCQHHENSPPQGEQGGMCVF